MIEAIIYKSKTGFAKRYAEIISEELNLKMYTIEEANEKLLPNSEVIYIAGLMATRVRSLAKVVKKFDVKYVLGVGMLDYTEDYEATIFGNNLNIPDKFYYLPGGFDYKNHKGLNKLAISIVGKHFVRQQKAAEKQNKELLPEDQALVDTFQAGYSDKVSKKHLDKFFKEFVK